MPEEATPATPVETPPSETPAPEVSPEASTSPSLGQELATLLANAQAQAPEKGAPDPNHFDKVNADHSREIGESRKQILELEKKVESLKSAPVQPTEDATELMFKDPTGFRRDFKAEIKAEIEAESEAKYGSTMRDARNMTVATKVANSDPILNKLLQDPETQRWLTDLSQDKQAISRFQDPEENQLRAAMLERMLGIMTTQGTIKENAPAPPRPENAGLPTPSSGPASTPSTDSITPEKAREMGMEKAWEAFASGAAPLLNK